MEYSVKFENNKLFYYVGESLAVIEAWPSLRFWVKGIFPKKCNKWEETKSSPYPNFKVGAIGFFASIEVGRSALESQVAMLPIFDSRDSEGFYKSRYSREVLFNKWYPKNRSKVLNEIGKFLNTFPERVRKAFVSWNYESAILWKALVFSKSYPEFLDLVESNPCLAFILSDKTLWKEDRKKPLSKLLNRKQKELVRLVGFNPKHLGILRKTQLDSITRKTIILLREILKNRICEKILLHCPIINPLVISFLHEAVQGGYTQKLIPKFIYQLPEIKKYYDEIDFELKYGSHVHPYYIGESAFYTWRDVINYFPNRNPESIAQMEKMHEEMIKDIHGKNEITNLQKNAIFPEPPFRKTDLLLDAEGEPVSFLPIISSRELLLEGKKFHNCIFSYNEKIQKGKVYFYKLLGQEQCHVSLRKKIEKGKTIWKLEEFKTTYNRMPNPESWKALLAWMKIHKIVPGNYS